MHIPSLKTKRTKNNKVLEHSVLCYFTVFSNIFENILPSIICQMFISLYLQEHMRVFLIVVIYIYIHIHKYIYTHTNTFYFFFLRRRFRFHILAQEAKSMLLLLYGILDSFMDSCQSL